MLISDNKFLFRDFDVELNVLRKAVEEELKDININYQTLSDNKDTIVFEGDTEKITIPVMASKWGGLKFTDIYTFTLTEIDRNSSKLHIKSRPKMKQGLQQFLGSDYSSEMMRTVLDDIRQRVKKIARNNKTVFTPNKTAVARTNNQSTRYSQSPRIKANKSFAMIDLKSLKQGSKYYALVIGNNRYKYIPGLNTAENDAKEFSSLLRKSFGFNTKLLLNATREQILKALSYYRTRLKKDDNFLIYYAGHGWLDEDVNEGYWLPVDAQKDNPANWLSNADITTTLRAIRARHVIIIADSCYSGKLTRGLSSEGMGVKSNNYLSRVLSKTSRTVLASGGLEPVADAGGKNNHSVFTGALINALQDSGNYILGTELFLIIRRSVILNAEQTPEYADIRQAGHDGGDFIFIK